MRQQRTYLVMKDTPSECSHTDLVKTMRELDLDRQSLGLLCEQQREVIVAMRQALIAARHVILQDASNLSSHIERDHLTFSSLKSTLRNDILLSPGAAMKSAQKTEYTMPRTFGMKSKYPILEEVVWARTKSLASPLCTLIRREIAQADMLVQAVKAGLGAAYVRISGHASTWRGRLLAPRDPWSRNYEKGHQHWAGWRNFVCGAVFAVTLGIVSGMILFDLVN